MGRQGSGRWSRFGLEPRKVGLGGGMGSRLGGGKQPWVVVAGPDCGLSAGDVDEYHKEPLT